MGRASYVPSAPGRFEVVATATDAAGRIGSSNQILQVYDPTDTSAPIVSFGPGLDGAKITSLTDLIGTISDRQLDEWVLSISDWGEENFRTLALGNTIYNNRVFSQFDPNQFTNGFYQLRLEASDLKGRTSHSQIVVEVNSPFKSARYSRTSTDLSVNLAGTKLDLVRRYDSLLKDEVGSFGSGWQLGNVETDISTNVGVTGKENLGVYNPFEIGTRLYLTFSLP
jgi:hypothetical protein